MEDMSQRISELKPISEFMPQGNGKKVKVLHKNICAGCGKITESEYEIESDFVEWFKRDTDFYCPECMMQRKAEIKQKTLETLKDECIANCDIPIKFREYDKEKGNYKLFTEIWHNRFCNLWISGTNNTGKTRSSCIALWHVVSAGNKGKFIRFFDLAAKYSSICKEKSERSEYYISDILSNKFLLIDDIGKRRLTETACELMFDIMDRLYSGDIDTIIWMTGNFDVTDFAEKFEDGDKGDAVASRIDRMIEDGRFKIIQA